MVIRMIVFGIQMSEKEPIRFKLKRDLDRYFFDPSEHDLLSPDNPRGAFDKHLVPRDTVVKLIDIDGRNVALFEVEALPDGFEDSKVGKDNTLIGRRFPSSPMKRPLFEVVEED